MSELNLFENTKLSAYFLWEHTQCDNALGLWFCAEDMACFFEQKDLLEFRKIDDLLLIDVYDFRYIQFVRQIAYRIHQYTGRHDEWHNWFAAERLLGIHEWVRAIVDMASIYRNEKMNRSFMSDVRSENVRAYYNEQTIQNP
jgi:hypothetical protein